MCLLVHQSSKTQSCFFKGAALSAVKSWKVPFLDFFFWQSNVNSNHVIYLAEVSYYFYKLSYLYFLSGEWWKQVKNIYIKKQFPKEERLGYICNPCSLKEGMETSRRRTDELGYRLERYPNSSVK